MTADSTAGPLGNISSPGIVHKRGALAAIVAAGLIAGTLDLLQALILFGRRVPRIIAAEPLGTPPFSSVP